MWKTIFAYRWGVPHDSQRRYRDIFLVISVPPGSSLRLRPVKGRSTFAVPLVQVSYAVPVRTVTTRPIKEPLPAVPVDPEKHLFIRYDAIDIAAATTKIIIQGVQDKKLFISAIVLTVGGETNLTFYDGYFPISGAMDFGGVSEPRGAVITHGDRPLVLGKGKSFSIKSSLAVQVSGYVVYYVID